MKNATILLLLSCLLLSTSCTKIILRAYGVKKPKPLSEQEVLKYAKKLNYDKYNLFVLDTSYSEMLEQHYSIDGITDSFEIKQSKAFKKQMSQMMQYQLFDESGNLITHIANCDVGGFPTLNWNAYGSFNSFPATTISFYDTTLNISQLQPYFRQANSISPHKEIEYQCVIFWNRFMSRHSKKLVRLALENIKQAESKGKNVKVYLVNNDNFYHHHNLGF